LLHCEPQKRGSSVEMTRLAQEAADQEIQADANGVPHLETAGRKMAG
jgi:hypothetical protein